MMNDLLSLNLSAAAAAIFKPFISIFFYSKTTFFITFPQGFRIFKNIGHLTSRNGGKKMFKRYLKSKHTNTHTNTQTNTQRDKHIDKSTYRKQRPRWPMLLKRFTF